MRAAEVAEPAPVDGLFEAMLTPAALHAAYRRAAKGKRRRADVTRFSWNEEAELCAVADALRDGSWQPGGYQHFERIERKRRIISVAPFRDGVVHHLLMAVVAALRGTAKPQGCVPPTATGTRPRTGTTTSVSV